MRGTTSGVLPSFLGSTRGVFQETPWGLCLLAGRVCVYVCLCVCVYLMVLCCIGFQGNWGSRDEVLGGGGGGGQT